MEQKEKQEIYSSDSIRKCGEVIMVVKIDSKVSYALNCLHCTETCLKLDKFISHIEELHSFLLMNAENKIIDEDVFSPELYFANDKNLITDYIVDTLVDNVDVSKSVEDILKISETEISTKSQDFSVTDPLNVAANAINKDRNLNLEGYLENIKDLSDGYSDNEAEEMANRIDETDDDDASEENETNYNDVLETWDNKKEFISTLIEEYQNESMLWDLNKQNYKKREESLKRLTNRFNEKLNTEMEWSTISRCIKSLRSKYRSELQQQAIAKEKNEQFTPVWYFEKLHFLQELIKCNPRKYKGTKIRSALPLPNLNDKQNFQLIEIYKDFPCLWDVQHIGYRFKNQRQKALADMVDVIKDQMKLTLTIYDLQKKLSRIRYACTQEKYRKLQCASEKCEYVPLCKFFGQIAFLVENVGPFKCSYCHETFNGYDKYKIHKSQHDGSMPFTCPLCNRGFMRVGNCTVHIRRHTRDYPFECKICGKSFATTTDINVHARIHSNEKPYFCEICGQSFRTWNFFDSHQRRHQKKPNHKCGTCNKAFYENNKLIEHMKIHLNIRDKVCNVCGKAFICSKYLRQHKQIHEEKKRYVCKICNKEFAQYAGLSGHMKSHGTTISGSITLEGNK